MAGPKTTFGDTTHLLVYSSSKSEGAHFPSRFHTYHVTMWLTKWPVENGWVIMTVTALAPACQKRSQPPAQYQHIWAVARAVRKGAQQLTLAKVWPGSAWQTSVTLVCSYASPLYKDWSFLWHIQFMACCFWWFGLQTWPSRLQLCIEWSMIMTCLSFPQSQCFLCSVLCWNKAVTMVPAKSVVHWNVHCMSLKDFSFRQLHLAPNLEPLTWLHGMIPEYATVTASTGQLYMEYSNDLY